MLGWRIFFLLAGLFNVAGGVLGFLDPAKPMRDAGLAPPLYPFAFRLLFLAVITLGVVYLLIARDPVRFRGLAWLGVATKAQGAAMTWWAIADAQLPPAAWWQPLVNDVVWLIGFLAFLAFTRRPLLAGGAEVPARTGL